MNQPISLQLEGFRQDMLRFALLQLRDEAAAEDAVQETMLAAIEAASGFNRRAQLKTWVFAILKNKIIDIIRRRCREPTIQTPVDEVPADSFEALFNERGHWRKEEKPANWGDPHQTLENVQFWRIFETCLQRLSDNTARIFMMREFLGFETEEICKELHISATNCWVVLHRARIGLRRCLESTWFDDERTTS